MFDLLVLGVVTLSVILFFAAAVYVGVKACMGNKKKTAAKPELPSIRPGDRIRAMLVSAMSLPDIPGMSPYVEGTALVLYPSQGTVLVEDGDGRWDCLLTGAVLLERPVSAKTVQKSTELTPVDIVATCLPSGRWEARQRGHMFPVADGATSDEAAKALALHLDTRRRPVHVQEQHDPGYLY
jgi:hypothetical protein